MPNDATIVEMASADFPIKELRRAVKILRKTSLPSRRVSPVLDYALVTISAGKVKITATDLDHWVAITIGAATICHSKRGSEVSFLVRIGALCGIAAAAIKDVTIRYDGEGTGATSPALVTLTDGEITLKSREIMDARDFPATAPITGQAQFCTSWSMSQAALARLIRMTRHCISNEETRYYLNGIFLTHKPETRMLRAVSTNGHRLAVVDSDVETDIASLSKSGTAAHSGVIVSRWTVDLLAMILKGDANEPVSVEIGETKMRISLPGIDLVFKLIDGTYPDYTRVIPENKTPVSITLSKQMISRLAQMAISALGKTSSHAAKISYSEKLISVSEDGNTVSLPFTAVEGVERFEDIGFNIGYLRDQAAVTPVMRLCFDGNDAGHPATIYGEDPDALFVLMPMRV